MSAFAYGFGPGLSYENANDLTDSIKAGIVNKKYVVSKSSYDKGVNGELDEITQKIVDDIILDYKSKGFNVKYVGNEFSGTFTPFRISLEHLKGTSDNLNIESLKKDSMFSFVKDAEFMLNENGEYETHREVEKMSKSK